MDRIDRNALRMRARLLRSQGKTYREISNLIGTSVPKGTLSGWLSDVPLPEDYHAKVKQIIGNNLKNGRIKARRMFNQRRAGLIASLRDKNSHLARLALNKKDVAKIALAMLYLGEGAKWKSHRGLMLGSSDPLIVKLYIKLLEHCYGIKREQLKCRVSYRADQNINDLEDFWSSVTSIPRENFYKTKPDPRTTGKKTRNQNYKGVCVVNGGGVEIQLELEQISNLLYWGL